MYLATLGNMKDMRQAQSQEKGTMVRWYDGSMYDGSIVRWFDSAETTKNQELISIHPCLPVMHSSGGDCFVEDSSQ